LCGITNQEGMKEVYKCIIVEDELPNIRLLESYVSNIESLELMATFVSPVDLINFKRLDEVDIIYLDIQMPVMTGIELLKTISTRAQVIMTTSYSDYAIEGFDLDVTDYLLKPIEFSRFLKASNKAIERIQLRYSGKQDVVPSVVSSKSSDEFVMLKVDKKLMKVVLKDIVFVQSDWNYVYVHTKTEKLVVLSTMKNIESNLNGDNFIRIHKSYLINLDYFQYLEGNQVSVNGQLLQVSRGYKADLLKRINA